MRYVHQLAVRNRNASMLSGWRAKDAYMPVSLRKQNAKNDRIAEAEAHERSGTQVPPTHTTMHVKPVQRVSPISPADHYHISREQRAPLTLCVWIGRNTNDAATKVCTTW